MGEKFYLFLGRFGRFIQLAWCHAHVVEDVGQLTRIDTAVVSYIGFAPFMHVEVTSCNE
jgi:hypothetical protein